MRKFFLVVRSVGWMLCWVAGSGTLAGQMLKPLHNSNYGKMFVVVVIDSTARPTFDDQVLPVLKRSPDAFLLVDGSVGTPAFQRDSLNTYLNQKGKISLQHVHLWVVGDSAFAADYGDWGQDFYALAEFVETADFASRTLLTTDDRPVTSGKYMTTSLSEADPEAILNGSRKRYRWMLDIENIERTRKYYPGGKGRATRLGLQVGVVFAEGEAEYENYPGVIFSYGLHVSRRLSDHWRWRLGLDLAINLPNPQSEVQAQVQSQIDIQDLIDNGGSQEIAISVDINGYIYNRLELQFQYMFLPEKPVTPYAGLGLSISNMPYFEATIATTVTIDGGNLGGGGGGAGIGGLGVGAGAGQG